VTLAEDKARWRRLGDEEAGRFTTADSLKKIAGALLCHIRENRKQFVTWL
jgi:hypothetical protein